MVGPVGPVDRRGGGGHMGRDEQHCRSWRADDELVADPKASEKPPWDIPDFDPSKPHRVLRDMERRLAIRDASLLAFLPPAFVLALGSALVWAFRGFR